MRGVETTIAFARAGRAPIETAVAFARSSVRGVETTIAFARAGRAPIETAVAFAVEKWVFLAWFSVAEVMVVSMVAVWGRAVVMAVSMVAVQGRAVVMVVSCWPEPVAVEVSLVSKSPWAGALSAKKFALHAQNTQKSEFLRLLGEFFRGNAAGGGQVLWSGVGRVFSRKCRWGPAAGRVISRSSSRRCPRVNFVAPWAW